jgi:hypothetical protein
MLQTSCFQIKTIILFLALLAWKFALVSNNLYPY